MALQRLAGNAAVTRLLARQDGVFNPLMEGYEKARKEREDFGKSGKKGPQTYNPSGSNPPTTTAASTSSTSPRPVSSSCP